LALFTDLFPGVVVDGVVDADRLGDLLGLPVAQGADKRERFGLTWAGKGEALEALRTPSQATLVPDLRRSVDFDTARNVFIEGDNLEVLKLLQKAYNDKVKLIYIDPPYNTGSSSFIYPDDFSDTLRAYLEYTGQLDEDGRRLSTAADMLGRRHSRCRCQNPSLTRWFSNLRSSGFSRRPLNAWRTCDCFSSCPAGSRCPPRSAPTTLKPAKT